MTQASYGQFCPVALAAEVLCTRWTMLLLRELMAGSTRFNDLRRGVPRMSPALLIKRLRDLEDAGIVRRVASQTEPGILEYHLTSAGRDLKPVVETMGIWGQRWFEADVSLQHLDPSLLMWDIHRNLDPTTLPPRRCVIQFLYPELPAARRRWWLLVEPGAGVDLCAVDPGFDIDLYVTTDLRTMTAIWMGLTTVRQAMGDGKLVLTGDRQVASQMQTWLGLSPFAAEKKLVSA
ncbi:winged helix-turn-helix transcriptional regulator [Sinorhizobium terangae]|uniref:Transcriptional regulator n=1 Tax=Sinorhizobium terangae TaxID=110322 RepID=A0A6N7L9B6_SINTE|nr:helix-turn-helix domain-containing protein [Sinorhizobium terangae]MBB4188020.1 DNA-binding HxlR family transcriptional regulator [Sinorhizobium terangae]MQX14401.1 transcriptional regulator [Sinorhizobium terangae]WFU49519.1 helix-turn-helix domain-containing protein [Sinorhizobium terangae]